MKVATALLAVSILPAPVAGALDDGADDETAASDVLIRPLRVLRSAEIVDTQNLFAWANPTECDDEGNVYFLQVPTATFAEAEEAKNAGRRLALEPRRVLRISADGKNTTTFDPANSPKLAKAKSISTMGMALDNDGSLLLLVWATSDAEEDGAKEARRQQIVGFSTDSGKFRSQVEIDWEELFVRQFTAFGAGDLLLRGSRGTTDRERIAILRGAGGTLQDVPGWSGYPSGSVDQQSDGGSAIFNLMSRGSDGRIYFVEQDAQAKQAVEYAFESSGNSWPLFELNRMPDRYQLLDLRSSGGRSAAVYFEPEAGGAPDGESPGRWWIAIYDNVVDAELQYVCGPVPQQPLCYQRVGSQDRFTFFEKDSLVTMAP